MRTLLFLLTTILITTSCRSIDKMVESGDYERAYRFAIDKLRGEKNKKTKYVKGLEKAYHELNKEDLLNIQRLRADGSTNALHKIVHLYEKIEARQKYVNPLLPLISAEGYLAAIKDTNFVHQILQAQREASDKHIHLASSYMTAARSGDRLAARTAHQHYLDASLYFSNFKGSETRAHEAYDLGQTHIIIETYSPRSYGPAQVAVQNLKFINTHTLNTKWNKYHTDERLQDKVHYVATIEILDTHLGTERERYNSFSETKEVITGYEEIVKKVKSAVDTTKYKTVQVPTTEMVTARVEELYREKSAELIGQIKIVDLSSDALIAHIPITVDHHFEDYSMRISGDERALETNVINRAKSECAPFPSDYDMIVVLTESFKQSSLQVLKQQRLD